MIVRRVGRLIRTDAAVEGVCFLVRAVGIFAGVHNGFSAATGTLVLFL